MFNKIFIILILLLLKTISLYAELSFNDMLNMYGSSFYSHANKDKLYIESRIDNRFITTFVSEPSYGEMGFKFETHLLSSLTFGNARKMIVPVNLVVKNDRTNLFNLTRIDTFNEHSRYSQSLTNKIDRFYFSFYNDNYEVTAGRNTITWSRGRIFHVADFFNPQTPAFYDTNYKLGTDLIYINYSLDSNTNVSIVANPKRDFLTEELTWQDSTFAIRYFKSNSNSDYSVSFAQYLRDYVFSIGSSLDFLYSSILRLDSSFWLTDYERGEIIPAIMIGIEKSDYYFDYSTTVYLEYYYNGLGRDNINQNISYSMSKRLQNQDTYLLGKNYFSLGFMVELTPYMNFNYSNIISAQDFSVFNLVSLTYSYSQKLDLGMTLIQSLGKYGDEFGNYCTKDICNAMISSMMITATYNF